jgi:hypothetical protein
MQFQLEPRLELTETAGHNGELRDFRGITMEHVVFAPCSRRKRAPIDPALRASMLRPASIEDVAKEWAGRLGRSDASISAESLYSGRGLMEARRAAAALGATLRIVSAGLGLVDKRQKVPAYSLTIANGDPDSIMPKVEGQFSAVHWWRALSQALAISGRAVLDIISERSGLAILALPGTYLELIAEEVVALPKELLARVRLVGAPKECVPPALRGAWMPYDARFDGVGGPNPGTRGDFAQRAARHFAEAVVRSAPQADATEHAELVERYLRPLLAPIPPRREVGTDAELVEVIRSLLPLTGGRSGETLRMLRREAGRACEQGRFRRLFAAASHPESPL